MTKEEREFLKPLIKGVFEECGKDYTDDMVENALRKIAHLGKETSEGLYNYEHPDYGKMVKDVPEVLKPLLNVVDNVNDLPVLDDLMDSCSSLDRITLAEAVSSLIYFCLDKWHSENAERKDRIRLYPLHVAIIMAEHFELRECLPALLETERQDRDFAEEFFDYYDLVGMVPACIYHVVTEEDLPLLTDFIRERGIYSFSKAEVIAAVSTLPRRLPQTLTAVQQWLCGLLSIFADHIDPEVGDVLLVEAIVHCCIHTRCVDAKPMIIRLYSKYKMPNILVPGGANEVRRTIKKATIGILKGELESAETIFRNLDYPYYDDDEDYDDEEDYDEDYDEDEEDYDEDEEDFDDYEEVDDEMFNDDNLAPRQDYCGFAYGGKARHLPVKVLKKYTLRIELDQSDPLVWRELEVPSSLSLTSLAQAILLAMGWNEDHLHQFLSGGKKRSHYATSLHELGSSLYPGTKDGSRYGVSHLLQKPGDSITFEYDYGDSWHHAVILQAVAEYADNEPKSVKLIGGANACPPDDCGGIYRYCDLVELMAEDPRSAELYDFYDWIGCKWDPEYFPLEQAAKAVARMNENAQ